MMKSCWYCLNELDIDDLITICQNCGSEQDFTEYKPTEPPKEEETMGDLKDRAREKSPFVTLAIGEETAPMVYKQWKETQDHWGNETFRYIFELETSKGWVIKQLDNRSMQFAEAMDAIPFGTKVILGREAKKDEDGNVVEDKSIWTVRKAE